MSSIEIIPSYNCGSAKISCALFHSISFVFMIVERFPASGSKNSPFSFFPNKEFSFGGKRGSVNFVPSSGVFWSRYILNFLELSNSCL